MFSAMKDAVAAKAAQHYLNHLVGRYGAVQELTLDSGRKTMELVCLPHGETTPIRLSIDRYEIEERDGKRFLQIGHCSCSRPWLQRLFEDFVHNRPIELPGWAASAL